MAKPGSRQLAEADLEVLVAAFAAGTLPRESWTHAAHLAVGLWAVREHGEAGALGWLRLRIRAYNGATGTANDDASGYHETITRLFVRGLAEHHARHRNHPLPESLALLLASPLADPAWPLRFLPRERLFSPEARRGWLAPPGWGEPPMRVRCATEADATAIAAMVGALLGEIEAAIGAAGFHFEVEATAERLRSFLPREGYASWIAEEVLEASGEPLLREPVGFLTLHEGLALYTEGAFGTIAELWVRPDRRSRGVGGALVAAARAHGARRGWRRIEVTTPPLPAFARTLGFYERLGFAVSGGRKLRVLL